MRFAAASVLGLFVFVGPAFSAEPDDPSDPHRMCEPLMVRLIERSNSASLHSCGVSVEEGVVRLEGGQLTEADLVDGCRFLGGEPVAYGGYTLVATGDDGSQTSAGCAIANPPRVFHNARRK